MNNYFFPEEFYPPVNNNYSVQVSNGLQNASKLNVLFVGTVRDASAVLNRNLMCLDHMRGFFNQSSVFIYENDSKDSTKEILDKYSKSHYNTVFSSESKGTNRLADQSLERRVNMANARNKYLEYAKKKFKTNPIDVLIVLDLDLLGGWSYTGLLTSFNYFNSSDPFFKNSCYGSNSIFYRNNERLYYDTWAYLDDNKQSETDKNLFKFHRGELLIPVTSCFGGLMIYPGNILQHDIQYTSEDCDHVTLNKQLTQLGYNIFLNPSQITLYSEHYYIT